MSAESNISVKNAMIGAISRPAMTKEAKVRCGYSGFLLRRSRSFRCLSQRPVRLWSHRFKSVQYALGNERLRDVRGKNHGKEDHTERDQKRQKEIEQRRHKCSVDGQIRRRTWQAHSAAASRDENLAIGSCRQARRQLPTGAEIRKGRQPGWRCSFAAGRHSARCPCDVFLCR